MLYNGISSTGKFWHYAWNIGVDSLSTLQLCNMRATSRLTIAQLLQYKGQFQNKFLSGCSRYSVSSISWLNSTLSDNTEQANRELPSTWKYYILSWIYLELPLRVPVLTILPEWWWGPKESQPTKIVTANSSESPINVSLLTNLAGSIRLIIAPGILGS